MTIIEESGMRFGEFSDARVFPIENSSLHLSFGGGIKTVEFLLLSGRDRLIFLEAKTTCPNAANKDETAEKNRKFKEYYSDITDKFIDSFQMLLTTVLKRHSLTNEIGTEIKEKDDYSKTTFYFILVIRNAPSEEWLAGPKAELESRLFRYQKIWKIRVLVLNESLAKEYGLIVKAS